MEINQEGFIIKQKKNAIKYSGINLSETSSSILEYIPKWNSLFNKSLTIQKDKIIFKRSDKDDIILYTDWLKKYKAINCQLIFFSEAIEAKSTALSDFVFIGFDCAYVFDEFQDEILCLSGVFANAN